MWYPLPLTYLTYSFVLFMLFVFYPTFFGPFSSSHILPPTLLSSHLLHSLSPIYSSFPPSSLITFPHLVLSPSFSCLRLWAMFTKHIATGRWSMNFAMITHAHTQAHAYVRAHSDLSGMVVDEQCQTPSIYGRQSCSRNLIRPHGHSMP